MPWPETPLTHGRAPAATSIAFRTVRERALLAAALLLLAAAPRARAAEISFVCPAGVCRSTASLPLPDRLGEIVVENLGPTASLTPYLRRADGPDLRSQRGILASILKPGMRPEAQALAIWEFVRRWRFGCAPVSEQSQALHDPVKLVNVFGCGLSDDSNAALAALAASAGMPARLWGLGGHVVAELFYDEAWHLFDAADGVYFRDAKGAVAGVETLAREPALVASPANRRLRHAAAVRMAELVSRGAGPTAGGHRAAVQRHFEDRYRAFLASRGENLPRAGRPDPQELDRIVFARYAALLASTDDNAVSDWWNTAASQTTAEPLLHPNDRLIFDLRPVGEAGMGCYLGADDCFDAGGRLERARVAPLLTRDAKSGRREIVETLPWAVEAIVLDGAEPPPGGRLDVYVAVGGGGWEPIGSLTAGRPLVYRLPPGEPRFAYRLTILRRGVKGADPYPDLRLTTELRVAAKSLPWPKPGGSPIVVDTGAAAAAAGAGLRVTYRRAD